MHASTRPRFARATRAFAAALAGACLLPGLFAPTAAARPTLPSPLAGGLVINEVVTDPQTDWSTTGFDGSDGGGPITEADEWLEIYNAGPATVDLRPYSLAFEDSSPAALDFSAPDRMETSMPKWPRRWSKRWFVWHAK